jgi:hypothetical protein
MIGYVSGHVKARGKISMVQRGSCLAFAGIAWGFSRSCTEPMPFSADARAAPASLLSVSSINLDGARVQAMARCLDTLYHFGLATEQHYVRFIR